MAAIRIGHGYDVHRLVDGRPLIIGGVTVPFEKGLYGHSDADVLVHAVMDAILGALAVGDIGGLFPDNDTKYKDADSLKLLSQVVELMIRRGYALSNLDATVLAQEPKLASYIPEMRNKLAGVFNADIGQVSVKATTEERLGFTGEGLGIAAHAVVLLDGGFGRET